MDGQKKLPLSRGGCYLMPTGYSFRHACDSRMEQLYFHLNLLDYSGADLFRSCRGLMEYTPGSEKDKRAYQVHVARRPHRRALC